MLTDEEEEVIGSTELIIKLAALGMAANMGRESGESTASASARQMGSGGGESGSIRAVGFSASSASSRQLGRG